MANVLLKSVKFPDLEDTYIIGDESLSVSGAAADAKVTGDALATKADADGSYDNLTAGNAKQLISNVKVNDKTPYIFRTSGGSVDIGDREYINGIVGGTVAWNQLAPIVTNTNKWTANTAFGTFTTSGNALVYTITVKGGSQSITISNTAGGIPIVKGHKIFTSFYMTSTEASSAVRVSSMNNQWVSMPSISANTKTLLTRIYESDQDTGGNAFWGIYPNLASGLSVGTVVTVEEIQVFDLTQMFGSTIADYLYSLETATAGAGVAFFKKLFQKPYYAYNAGELLSVSGVSAHNMTGFNQWDEEWEVYGSSQIKSKNLIPLIPNTTYYLKAPTGIGATLYFKEDIDIPSSSNWSGANETFTVPSNIHYAILYAGSGYGTTYKNDICINIAWDNSRNGEYEPYELHSYPLDSDLTLRGIPKLDANNELYYDGDVYEADGTVTRKYGIVDLGTLTWILSGTESVFYATQLASLAKASSYCVCGKYSTVRGSSAVMSTDKSIGFSGDKTLYAHDSSYSDATAFKTAMSGVYLVYELATPTTETAEPYTTPQIVDDFGTEEYVISDNTFAVPVGHDTDYPINMVAKLEMAPNSPEGDGDYIVRQTNGTNTYVPLIIEDALPTMPTTAGSYKLTVTIAEGSDPVLSWEAE